MYLAPLNYDRYFKKIFSEPRFAKRFLEDFFDVTIESIEILATEHRVTDDASLVEFDFRCKIEPNFFCKLSKGLHQTRQNTYLYNCRLK
jgi:hypothetical protein